MDDPSPAHVSTSPQRTLCLKSQRNSNPRHRALSLGRRRRKHQLCSKSVNRWQGRTQQTQNQWKIKTRNTALQLRRYTQVPSADSGSAAVTFSRPLTKTPTTSFCILISYMINTTFTDLTVSSAAAVHAQRWKHARGRKIKVTLCRQHVGVCGFITKPGTSQEAQVELTTWQLMVF